VVKHQSLAKNNILVDLARLCGFASVLAFASAGYREVVPCDRLPARK